MTAAGISGTRPVDLPTAIRRKRRMRIVLGFGFAAAIAGIKVCITRCRRGRAALRAS
jgi:hypothetical protein